MVVVEPECIPDEDGAPLLPGVMHDLVVQYRINHVNLVNVLDPASQARWKNAVDVLAARTDAGHPGHGVE